MESFGGTANGIKIPTFVFSEEEEAEQWRRRLPQPLQSGPQRKFPFLLRAALTLLLLLFGITGRIGLAVNTGVYGVSDLCVSLSFASTGAYCVPRPSGALAAGAAALLAFSFVFLALCQQPIPSWAFPSLLSPAQDVQPA